MPLSKLSKDFLLYLLKEKNPVDLVVINQEDLQDKFREQIFGIGKELSKYGLISNLHNSSFSDKPGINFTILPKGLSYFDDQRNVEKKFRQRYLIFPFIVAISVLILTIIFETTSHEPSTITPISKIDITNSVVPAEIKPNTPIPSPTSEDLVINGGISYSMFFQNINDNCPLHNIYIIPDEKVVEAIIQDNQNRFPDYESRKYLLIPGSLSSDLSYVASNDGDFAQIPWNLILRLSLWNTQENDNSWIKIDNLANIKITSYQPSKEVNTFKINYALVDNINSKSLPSILDESSNYLSCLGGGPGYNMFYLPAIILSSSNWKTSSYTTQLSDMDYITLQPGELETLTFLFQCSDPGQYEVQVEIAIENTESRDNYQFPVKDIIVCPSSFTNWDISSDFSKMYKSGEYVLQDGYYQITQ